MGSQQTMSASRMQAHSNSHLQLAAAILTVAASEIARCDKGTNTCQPGITDCMAFSICALQSSMSLACIADLAFSMSANAAVFCAV